MPWDNKIVFFKLSSFRLVYFKKWLSLISSLFFKYFYSCSSRLIFSSSFPVFTWLLCFFYDFAFFLASFFICRIHTGFDIVSFNLERFRTIALLFTQLNQCFLVGKADTRFQLIFPTWFQSWYMCYEEYLFYYLYQQIDPSCPMQYQSQDFMLVVYHRLLLFWSLEVISFLVSSMVQKITNWSNLFIYKTPSHTLQSYCELYMVLRFN